MSAERPEQFDEVRAGPSPGHINDMNRRLRRALGKEEHGALEHAQPLARAPGSGTRCL